MAVKYLHMLNSVPCRNKVRFNNLMAPLYMQPSMQINHLLNSISHNTRPQTLISRDQCLLLLRLFYELSRLYDKVPRTIAARNTVAQNPVLVLNRFHHRLYLWKAGQIRTLSTQDNKEEIVANVVLPFLPGHHRNELKDKQILLLELLMSFPIL